MVNGGADKSQHGADTSLRVAAFTAYPWAHALPTLRLVDPLYFAGLELIHGNDEAGFYPEVVENADLVVIQRDFPRWEAVYDEVVKRARAGGKPVIYETDDLLLELPDDHPDRPIHYYTPALLPMLRALVEADAVTTTTPALCDYLKALNPNVILLPNYLDDRCWTVRDPASLDPPASQDISEPPGVEALAGPSEGEAAAATPVSQIDPRPVSSGSALPVTIGYMGSTSHAPDLAGIAPALTGLLMRYGDRLQLHFWGGPPPEALRGDRRVKWTDLQMRNYAEFAAYFSQQESDIFIAPLADTFFNRCKSAVKFLEYSALGIPGVYGRVEPYADIVRHGENGFLASEPEEWESCLGELVEDAGLRRRVGKRAAETVWKDWLLSQNARRWVDAYMKAQERAQSRGEQNVERSRIFNSVTSQVHAWQEQQARELEGLQSQLAASEGEIMALRAELKAIHTSNGWAFLQRLLHVRRWLIPEGSSRESWLRRLLKNYGSK